MHTILVKRPLSNTNTRPMLDHKPPSANCSRPLQRCHLITPSTMVPSTLDTTQAQLQTHHPTQQSKKRPSLIHNLHPINHSTLHHQCICSHNTPTIFLQNTPNKLANLINTNTITPRHACNKPPIHTHFLNCTFKLSCTPSNLNQQQCHTPEHSIC